MFRDISNFKNVNDYLPIFNATLITDLAVIILFFYIIPNRSKTLEKWYMRFNLSAVVADVFIIVIGFILARYAYSKLFTKWDLLKFLMVIVSIQVVHDFLFYFFFMSVPPKKNYMIDMFKEYAKENGIKALIADSCMMIVATLLACILKNMSLNSNIILMISLVYLVPYLVYIKKI
mgnify:CR=1 FL=1